MSSRPYPFLSSIFYKIKKLMSNPSVMVVFIPLWQRGIKGDFKIMLGKSPLPPLFQRGV
jgi:hypothetical protein